MENKLLFDNLNRYTTIGAEDFERIESCLTKRFVKKKRSLLQEGDVCNHLYFVTKGALRSYRIDMAGNEHIMQFALEDHWVADLASFITQSQGDMYIETIEDSEILLLPYKELQGLLIEMPSLEKFFRQLFQHAYVSLQRRVALRESKPAKDRYLELIAAQPSIAKRIPLLYIASYLGITAESLSRVRGNIANGK
ncbi:MAG: Crp/Fnr family transcriptional regulator [Chryseobacterium sp.]|nr:MAG: Crp/Fnr family transcriptional regulator [Chryseobacterium sp.]